MSVSHNTGTEIGGKGQSKGAKGQGPRDDSRKANQGETRGGVSGSGGKT